jgi:hypothetical protein
MVRRERAPVASRLLVVVQPTSERTLDPVRRDNSSPEKQESHLARVLVSSNAEAQESAADALARA